MKWAAFTATLLLSVMATTNAQLSFLPQLGIERSKTSVSYNNVPSFSPMGSQGNLKANLRMDYRFKKGHGPYIGIGTTPGTIAFSFNDPSNAATDFKAVQNSLQWKLEGGYQYTSKPVTLKKSNTKKVDAKTSSQNTEVKRSCGSYSNNYRQKTSIATVKQNKDLNLRLQPSVGIAYLPSVKDDLVTNGSGYQYNAGNYKTAFTSGMGFEIGKGKQRLFTLSLVYTKALDQNDKQTIQNVENNKVVDNVISSSTSNWGLLLGVPFSLSKNKKTAPAVKTEPSRQYRGRCQSYKAGCVRRI
jgi:hypothetical protein